VFLQDALREVKVLPVTRGCHVAHFDCRDNCRNADAQDVHGFSNCLQYLSRSIKDAVRQKVEKDRWVSSLASPLLASC
jgi:hypothetical protein